MRPTYDCIEGVVYRLKGVVNRLEGLVTRLKCVAVVSLRWPGTYEHRETDAHLRLDRRRGVSSKRRGKSSRRLGYSPKMCGYRVSEMAWNL